MHRKLKALGLALVAALALTAVMASAASAQFTSNKAHTTLSGSQKENTNDVFSAGEGFGGITCETATFSGTMTSESQETLVITPTYANCKDSFGRTVDITTNTLQYTFTSGSGPNGGKKGDVDVAGEIVLTVTTGGSKHCTVTIKSQTNGGVTYKNLGGTKGTETTTHATNVQSTTSGGFLNCGVSDGGHGAGTYDGTSVVTGKAKDGSAAELFVH